VRSLRLQLGACVALGAAVRLAAYGPLERADVTLLEHATRLRGLGGIGLALIGPFDPGAYLTLAGAFLVAALLAGRGRVAVVAVAAMGGAAVTTQLLKHLLAAPRLEARGFWLPPDAWPSGHTTAAAALAFGLVLVTRSRVVGVLCALGVAAVGAALVVLGRHYPSDVLGGACVAGAWGAVAAWASRRAPQAVR
jgi:membrane-associated phospholipid phosphatase